VVKGQLHANNLPWTLNPSALAQRLDVGLENIVLLNDMIAAAWSLDQLPANDLAVLNRGVSQPNATRALMAVGTGLGEAFLVWDGRQNRVFPSEGGLAGFAPRTDREIRLLTYLSKRLPQVCCEDVLSGRGIRAIHEFLNPQVRHSSFDAAGRRRSARDQRQRLLTHLRSVHRDHGSLDGSVWLRSREPCPPCPGIRWSLCSGWDRSEDCLQVERWRILSRFLR
jgi:glucokinase